MNDEEPPRIEFPCIYPIKVIGDSAPDFKALVVSIVQRFDPKVSAESVELMPSRHGNYYSLRINFNATGEQQIADLFEALKATGRVRMVL